MKTSFRLLSSASETFIFRTLRFHWLSAFITFLGQTGLAKFGFAVWDSRPLLILSLNLESTGAASNRIVLRFALA